MNIRKSAASAPDLVAAVSGDLTPAERIDLATEVQRLHEEKGRIEAELPDIEAELAIKRRELDKLSQTLAVTTY